MHNNQNFTLSKDVYKSSLLAQAKILGLSIKISNIQNLDNKLLESQLFSKTNVLKNSHTEKVLPNSLEGLRS
jgi:hypothetical protein